MRARSPSVAHWQTIRIAPAIGSPAAQRCHQADAADHIGIGEIVIAVQTSVLYQGSG